MESLEGNNNIRKPSHGAEKRNVFIKSNIETRSSLSFGAVTNKKRSLLMKDLTTVNKHMVSLLKTSRPGFQAVLQFILRFQFLSDNEDGLLSALSSFGSEFEEFTITEGDPDEEEEESIIVPRVQHISVRDEEYSKPRMKKKMQGFLKVRVIESKLDRSTPNICEPSRNKVVITKKPNLENYTGSLATDQNFINQPFGCRSTKNHSFPPNIIIQSPDQNILKQRVNKSIMDQSVYRSILNQAPDRSNINHPFNQSIMNLFSPERRKQQVDNEVEILEDNGPPCLTPEITELHQIPKGINRLVHHGHPSNPLQRGPQISRLLDIHGYPTTPLLKKHGTPTSPVPENRRRSTISLLEHLGHSTTSVPETHGPPTTSPLEHHRYPETPLRQMRFYPSTTS